MATLEVNEDDFQEQVLDRSEELPVVVDFWAPWCGPCRSFGPVLERAADDRAELLTLVKVDTEANPNLAAHYNVHGIPAVKAFHHRELVAQFVGARPPERVRRFLDALGPTEIDALLARGDEASLRRAVELDRRRADAAVALASLLHQRGETTAALEVLKPAAGGARADGLAARIRLDAAAEQLDLAAALAALDAGESARALDLLLTALAGAPGDQADLRQIIVSELDRLGFGHPLARDLRSRLGAPAGR